MNTVSQRILSFVKRAGSIILIFSVFLWLFSTFPGKTVEESYLAKLGKGLEKAGSYIGLDWRLTVALISSVIAKENSVATLGVLYGAADEGLRKVIRENVSPASLLSFLVILMLFIPCIPTTAVLKSEMGSWKYFWLWIFGV